MNEIEMAIKSFEKFKEMGYSHSNLPSSWSIELALAALREKAERETKRVSETPIVHCQDCEYLGIKDFVYGFCTKNMRGTIKPDDYCSRGRQSEEGER